MIVDEDQTGQEVEYDQKAFDYISWIPRLICYGVHNEEYDKLSKTSYPKLFDYFKNFVMKNIETALSEDKYLFKILCM